MDAGKAWRVRVADWAALITENGTDEELGAIAAITELPPALRRRCPAFLRNTLRIGLRLLHAKPHSDIIFSSCHGDLAATVQMLTDINAGTLVSPAQFSLSVHNAAAGLLGQALGHGSNHSAIAAGEQSLCAGLTDACARLSVEGDATIVFIYADVALPPPYEEFDEDGPGVYLALLLQREASSARGACVLPGRQGAAALARALQQGKRTLEFSPPSLSRATR